MRTKSENIKKVMDKEKKALDIADGKPSIGIAISGGGIRSASFGLGVLQALLAHNILQKAHYLSTVSGGGYIGSALTWFRHRHAGSSGDFFDHTAPLGVKRKGERGNPTFVNFLQQHGNYLAPGKGLNLASVAAVLIRSLLVSVFVYFSFLLAGISIIGLFAQAPGVNDAYDSLVPDGISAAFVKVCEKESPEPVYGSRAEGGDTVKSAPCPAPEISCEKMAFFRLFAVLSVCAGMLFILTALLFCLLSASLDLSGSMAIHKYPVRNFFQKLGGWILVVFIACLVLMTVPVVQSRIQGGVAALGLAGYISGAWGSLSKLRQFMGSRTFFRKKWIGTLLFRLSAVLFVYASLVTAFHLSLNLCIPAVTGKEIQFSILIWPGLILLAAFFLGWILNINDSTAGSMYRDRLMETFLPEDKAFKKNRWLPAKDADKALLEDMCKNGAGNIRKPYHLINTNIILFGSDNNMHKNRGGDSFLLSPLYCGSDATGYIETKNFIKNKSNGKTGMTLATAMAASGAAVNPHAGVGGTGPTRDRFVSLMMTVFNLRLGFWVTNPKKGAPRSRPNYLTPGLCSLLGCYGHDEDNTFIELSDGGHFENLGLYELVRRRVDTVIVSDGTADRDFNFGSLANALERVKSDFGVVIRFKPEEEKLGNLLPGSFPDSAFTKKFKLAKKGYAKGTIHYPEIGGEVKEKVGTIILVKSTLLPNLPADLYGYRARNPDFPDQSTGDQFFDENQFEAYRELGYQAGKAAAEAIGT